MKTVAVLVLVLTALLADVFSAPHNGLASSASNAPGASSALNTSSPSGVSALLGKF